VVVCICKFIFCLFLLCPRLRLILRLLLTFLLRFLLVKDMREALEEQRQAIQLELQPGGGGGGGGGDNDDDTTVTTLEDAARRMVQTGYDRQDTAAMPCCARSIHPTQALTPTTRVSLVWLGQLVNPTSCTCPPSSYPCRLPATMFSTTMFRCPLHPMFMAMHSVSQYCCTLHSSFLRALLF
jgi:hypothetical protein